MKLKIFLSLLLSTIAIFAHAAAVTQTGTPCGGGTTTASPGTSPALTISCTVPSVTNGAFVAVCSLLSTTATMTATYNGSGMTQLAGARTSFSTTTAEIFYQLNPTATTANLVISTSTSVSVTCVGYTLQNVSQSAPFGTPVQATGTWSTQPRATVSSSNANNLIIDGESHTKPTDDTAPSTTIQTLISNSNASAAQLRNRIYSSKATGGSSTTMGYNITTSNPVPWAMVAVEVNEAVSATNTSTVTPTSTSTSTSTPTPTNTPTFTPAPVRASIPYKFLKKRI